MIKTTRPIGTRIDMKVFVLSGIIKID